MLISKYQSPAWLLASVMALASGCAADFNPPSYLEGLRVLALIADPVELGPDDRVAITPVVYLSSQESLTRESWTFCPFSLGPTAGYQCALPACEVELTPNEEGRVTAVPGQLAIQCAGEFDPGELPQGIPSELPEKVDVYFTYLATSSAGDSRQAVLRLALWTTGPPVQPNQSPVISSVSVAGRSVATGDLTDPISEDHQAQIRVQIDPDSLDTYVDDNGDSRTEEPILSFYASAGRFEFDRLTGNDVSVSWKAEELEPGQDQADLYVAVRDLRGGQAVFGPVFVPLLR